MMVEDAQFKLRLSPALKERIEAARYANRRTLNKEIVLRLERTFTEDEERARIALEAIKASPLIKAERQIIASEARLMLRIEELEARVEKLESKK